MSLKNAIDNLKFDARMIDINFKNQTVSPEELKKQLDKLVDVKSASIPLDIESSDNDSLNGDESEMS